MTDDSANKSHSNFWRKLFEKIKGLPKTLVVGISQVERQKKWAVGIMAFVFVVFVGVNIYFGLYESFGGDWKEYFGPTTQTFLRLQNPYGVGVSNPPWVFLILAPAALLPIPIGTSVMFAVGFFGYAFAAYKFGAKPWQVVLFMLTPSVLLNTFLDNIDWLVALGFIMPAQWGLFFVLLKPQLGIAVAIFWAVEAYRTAGWRNVLRVFAPVTVAFVISYLIYGPFWNSANQLIAATWNTSLWPSGIAIGLGLLASAIRTRSLGNAISASPFLAVYLSPMGWAIALFGMLRNPWVFVACWLGVWLEKFL